MSTTQIIPIPRIDVTVRDATPADVPFVDRLQKANSHALGFMRESWIVGKINGGQVIVAEDAGGQPVGYCMGVDRYFKRDDVGIIHQLNVAPGRQRGFVGATLLKAMFDRAAYGCRLFCCWCAQDLPANRFWEAMGFVPLAYRAGSEKKARIHIFWQKRIRAGDTGGGATPYWFPAETTGGQMGAARIVLPIPPGKHWSDEMPVVVLPGMATGDGPPAVSVVERKALPGPRTRKPKVVAPVSRRLSFAPVAAPKVEKAPRKRKPKLKNDPKLVAAARELRDRWLEQVNAGAYVLEEAGKYDVSRGLPDTPVKTVALLPAA